MRWMRPGPPPALRRRRRPRRTRRNGLGPGVLDHRPVIPAPTRFGRTRRCRVFGAAIDRRRCMHRRGRSFVTVASTAHADDGPSRECGRPSRKGRAGRIPSTLDSDHGRTDDRGASSLNRGGDEESEGGRGIGQPGYDDRARGQPRHVGRRRSCCRFPLRFDRDRHLRQNWKCRQAWRDRWRLWRER